MPSLSMTRLQTLAPRMRRRWLAAAALWLLLCLLWTAPAALFAVVLQAALPPLQLEAVTGSFWQGRAGQAHWDSQGRRFTLGALEWRLNPWSLLWLRPGGHVAANYGQQFIDTDVSVGLGGVRLADTRAALPLPALSAWLPAPADGLLTLQLKQARFDGERLRRLQGDVDLQQVRWQWGGRWLVLGDYRVQLGLDGDRLSGEFNGGTALGAQGQLEAEMVQRSYRVNGILTTDAQLPQEFRDGIGLLLAAKPLDGGRWQLDRSGGW